MDAPSPPVGFLSLTTLFCYSVDYRLACAASNAVLICAVRLTLSHLVGDHAIIYLAAANAAACNWPAITERTN